MGATTSRHETELAGLRLRPYAGESDLADIVRIENAEAGADGIPERSTAAQMGVRYSHPSDSFNARRDVTLAEVDGRPVAVASREWVETTDGLLEYRGHGAVDPAWRRRGIGTTMLAENERLLRELAATHDPGRPRVFGSWTAEAQPGGIALLQHGGYAPVRRFFEMVRPNMDDIPDVAMPEGLEIRPITPELTRTVWRADIEAFRDHWGGFDDSDERLEGWLAQPTTDLTLWMIAFDGDEVAGGVLNEISPEENEALGIQRGWLASVFTRRPWRRRGLARALTTRSLVALRDRGMTTAGLGVDADNPTGALGLYEGLGFAVDHRFTAWRKGFDR
jgi:ribosomal protein S18 acetylase RimI-like enzyme